MTSWYGLGSTLQNLKKNDPEGYAALKLAKKHDPFIRYILTNVDTSLAATDEAMMKQYASLVTDEKVKQKFLGYFLDELNRTRESLHDLLESDIADRRKQHYYSNQLRASLLTPLHEKQIALLKKWRAEKAANNGVGSEKTLLELLITINAIASAMRNTG